MTIDKLDAMAAPDVLSDVVGGVGFITLNRPRALNALCSGAALGVAGLLLRRA